MHDKSGSVKIGFDVDLGLNTLKGIFTLEGGMLNIEWRRYDLFEAPVSQLETVTVPLTDLASVSVRRKFRRPVIEIAAHSASAFGTIPLPAGNLSVMKARVAKQDRAGAEAWGAEASLRIAEAMSGGGLLE